MNGTPPSSRFSAVLKNVICVGYRVIAETTLALSNSTHDVPPCLAATPTPIPQGPAPTTAMSITLKSESPRPSTPGLHDNAMHCARPRCLFVEWDEPQSPLLPAVEHIRVVCAR